MSHKNLKLNDALKTNGASQRKAVRQILHQAGVFSSMDFLEARRLMSGGGTADIRSFNGTGNNLAHTTWASAGQDLVRITPSAYADGKSAVSGASRPSARAVSNALASQSTDILSKSNLSAYAYLWGQFIDHDLDLTTSATPSESFPASVPTGDPQFDPNSTGTKTIGLTRSKYDTATGTTNARQQVNDISAFLDGSMVYGSDTARASALRTMTGGKLKTSTGNLLPFNTAGLDNQTLGGPASTYFVAGDVRANENIELTAIQTLFMREHNRLADQIAAKNPSMTDEQVYQSARRLVIAEIQNITYTEYLPALLGPKAIAAYKGYKANVNAEVSNEFSTAAFRLGHSMLANDVEFFDNNGNDVAEPIDLSEAFFSPSKVSELGIDPTLKYLASSNSQEVDGKVVDSLRNFLFGQPGQGGFDLASLNIQRGRDHGLSDYNSTRAALGLGRVSSFAQISSDPAVQAALKSTYGSVDNIDLWVGGLAEDHVAGSSLGKTFQKILVDQFTRTRDGDRFWCESSLSVQDLKMVRNTHLVDVIRMNSGTTNLQPDVFHYNVVVDGHIFADFNLDGRPARQETGLADRTVTLTKADGTILTTKTDARGNYAFSGISLGTYTVTTDVPAGWTATGKASFSVVPTRATHIGRIDFGQTDGSAPGNGVAQGDLPTNPPLQGRDAQPGGPAGTSFGHDNPARDPNGSANDDTRPHGPGDRLKDRPLPGM